MTSSRSEVGRGRAAWWPANLVEALLVAAIVAVLAASAGVGIRIDPTFWGGDAPTTAAAAETELGRLAGR